MDIATGMMMVALALYQDAESPLGYVALLQGDQEGKREAAESIAENFLRFERETLQSGQDESDAIYQGMRELAEWYESKLAESQMEAQDDTQQVAVR